MRTCFDTLRPFTSRTDAQDQVRFTPRDFTTENTEFTERKARSPELTRPPSSFQAWYGTCVAAEFGAFYFFGSSGSLEFIGS